MSQFEDLAEQIKAVLPRLSVFRDAVSQVLVGQRHLVDRLLIALLTDGHILLEGVPGLAKTLAVRATAAALQLKFSRVQFTPDLLPSDLVGTQIYNPRTGEFTVRTGPILANVVLADEINRAPAKVQSALLEAMAERQITIGESTIPLPKPFLVLATQNPLEQEGTFPLPEAQLDRFQLKVVLDYPKEDEELGVLRRMGKVESAIEVPPVWDATELFELRRLVDKIYTAEPLERYIVAVVRATRRSVGMPAELARWIQVGASPRATLALARCARANALLAGRCFATPQDVKDVAEDVLQHRVAISYEAEAEEISSVEVIRRVLASVPVP